MRGGKTGWYSPLLMAFLALLPAGCNLELKVAEPYLEVQIAALYNPPNPVPFQYRFFADEPVLRCRYALSTNGEAILAGETEPEAAGVWHDWSLQVPELAEGPYQLDLVVQTERSREFVDLPFLTKSVNFYVDHGQPVPPEVDLPNTQRFTTQQSVQFTHPEWPVPQISPVKVYCTTDGTDPGTSATRILYAGSPVPLPFNSGIVTLKAIAEDEARNKSEIKQVSYYFLHIDSINPSEGPVNTAGPFVISGFGFTGVTTSHISMTDAAGRGRTLYFSGDSIAEDKITFMADLVSAPEAPVGPAIISITNTVTVTVPFQVK